MYWCVSVPMLPLIWFCGRGCGPLPVSAVAVMLVAPGAVSVLRKVKTKVGFPEELPPKRGSIVAGVLGLRFRVRSPGPAGGGVRLPWVLRETTPVSGGSCGIDAQSPGPGVLSMNPDTVPLNTDEFVEPAVVFTTMTKFEFAATV